MAADRERSDELPAEHDDGQLEQLLKSAYAAPEISPEFAETLCQQLDRQFAQSRGPDQPGDSGKAPSLNGVARVATLEPDDKSIPPEELRVSPSARSVAAGRWSKLGLAGTALVAASLLLALSMWSSRPVYGWAAMMQALEQCDWVQAVSASSSASGWVSSKRGVMAVRAKDGVVFRDQHVRSAYRTGGEVIRQEPLKRGSSGNSSARLIASLLSQDSGKSTDWNESEMDLELASESWREIETKDGKSLIELSVSLKIVGSKDRLVKLIFLVDPETQLPVAYREVGQETDRVSEFEFKYPEEGPTTIFALGVPEDAEVVVATVAVRSDSVSDAAAVEPSEDQIAANTVKPTEDLAKAATRADPLSEQELRAELNGKLATYWDAQGVHRAAPATDAEFLRRVYLDLTGRIPVVSEAYRFFEDSAEDRREHLVDELLLSRDHATHLATVWRGMLLPEEIDLSSLGGADKFDAWLADQFGENLPYDQLARDLLMAEGRVSESGPLLFYAALKLNPEELAAKTSRVFLGMRMECAQCHDHPFDGQITQEDFWGFAAFFAQISRPQGKMEMTSSVLRVHDSREGEVTIPETDIVVPPRLPMLANSDVSATEDENAPSRRQQLVDWLASQHNDRFAPAAVNRVWQHLFGRGLVEPVDDMRAENEPLIPEVLEFLSRDFAASGYDFRRLLRTLVLSDSYQLSSRAETDDPSQSLCFARMNIKSLTAEQLYDCIAVATQNEAMLAGNTPEEGLARVNNTSRAAFIAQFRAPAGQKTDYHAGIPQALTLMHGQLIHSATDLASSGLLKSLAAPFFSDEQRLETLFLATLSRFPEAAERDQMLEYITASTNDTERQNALGDVLWALLNSAEFTFNH